MISTELQSRVDDIRLLSRESGLSLAFEDIGDDLILVQNQKNLKSGIMGLVEINGDNVCVAYMINFKKWAWAENEGFSADEIISSERLKKEVFLFVSLDRLIPELS